MKELLNPYQKNSLRVSLMMFEENLRHALEWLDGREENGTLYSRKLDLPEGKKVQAQQEINAALGLIDNLGHRFDLPRDTHDAASIFRGELTVNWANLMDTRAGKMRRYGKVHPELASMLDSEIQKLAEIALRLSAILGESQQEKK